VVAKTRLAIFDFVYVAHASHEGEAITDATAGAGFCRVWRVSYLFM